MVPYLSGKSPSNYGCYDEMISKDEPIFCEEELKAYCMIDIVQKADSDSAQDKIVQWQICHSNGISFEKCDAKVGVKSADVQACVTNTTRIHPLMQRYIDRGPGQGVHGVPHEFVNGKEVGSSYAAVKNAICAADSSLSACASVQV